MWIQDPEKWTKPVSVHFHVSTGFHESKSSKNLSAHADTPVSARMQVPVSARMHTKDIYTDTLIKDKTTDMPAAPLILNREEQEEMFPDSEGWSW